MNVPRTIDRIAAAIIRDKKLLLVTGFDEEFYWTPGGKRDGSETDEQALGRELREKLGIEVRDYKPYITYEEQYGSDNNPDGSPKVVARVICYTVEYEGALRPQKEITKTLWYSREHFEKNEPWVARAMKQYLLPKLAQDNLL